MGVTEGLRKSTHTVNPCKLLRTAEPHCCQLFPGPSETEQSLGFASLGWKQPCCAGKSLAVVTSPTSQTPLEQRLEQIAPMLYQLQRCRNCLHSKRCHNCTNIGLPNPIIQLRHAPGYTHSKPLMKSMFSNQVVVTGEPPASEDLPWHHGTASKVRTQSKGKDKLLPGNGDKYFLN